MSVKDDLLKLKIAAAAVTSTDAGWTTKTRDTTTGKVVVQIDKCPLGGVPIEVIAAADTGTSNDKTMIVTIEASDELATEWLVVATFPTILFSDTAALRFVRNIATQLKYLRSVITVAGSNGTISRIFEIHVGVGLVDDDYGYTG
ncbi:hypothetical protein LCGC14_2492330 [marine sediment metagenome]|uniref:Uncharacterized protein n=1 Tax=marine sediment metagenome TaxID=412755 RepID=A0A0F9DG92_9ZZZZ